MRIAISIEEQNDQAVKSVRAFLEGRGIDSYLLGNKPTVKDLSLLSELDSSFQNL
ncbi:MAG: hypothetical protein HZA82_04765 [Thaumarchaeota archaeon]|nr:hypothetical protein [Nitrososphaerota archaeon]